MKSSPSLPICDELYPDRLGAPVTCIGAGGIGSALIPMLVRAGIKRMVIWDNDKVEPKNLQMQNFYKADLGKHKAAVLANRAILINPSVRVTACNKRFTHPDRLDGIVLSAVDSIESREVIFEALKRQLASKVTEERERVFLLVDGRLTRARDFLDLYFIDPHSEVEMENYEASLFDPGNAEKSPRADGMTAHVPYMLSGLIGEALAKWAKDRSHPWKVTYDATISHIEKYETASN